MNDIHNILFNAHILFSIALGVWSVTMAVRNQPISGNFWGSLATITILAAAITLVGVIMTLMGLRPPRIVTYYLYMSWLVVIMPGLFTMLRGRDDRNAAIAFAILCFFNATTSFSMLQREVVGPWMLPGA
ncbi:MAG: hypothetical protein IPO91_28295 [Chloroflexi bacterium]|uniref:hypothetical protein n=1 Tax=Candidatus Flexifilum breve TaxID=3140694 RepID=UPI003135379F|nr:hypothetical protein [Chloroflexota bacterium]MBK9750640.1 hypothetical protein [Chloroflexota bacterium]